MLQVQALVGKSDYETVRTILTAAPYHLKVKDSARHPTLYIVTYNQTKSDFNNPIVCECRGIILEKDTNAVVCLPFTKFWNVGESRAASIMWDSAQVLEKYDGSLIKMYRYNEEWIIATNGTIDARDATIQQNHLDDLCDDQDTSHNEGDERR